MRLTAIFPLLCVVASLVLSFLCLFAGSSKDFIQDADIMTLNISMIGRTSIFDTDNGDDFFSDFIDDVQSDIEDAVNEVTTDLAQELNLHDFYKAHILNYCEGFYEPNATMVLIAGSDEPSENVTRCSDRTALFHFDPTKIIEDELVPGVELSDINWPDSIEDGIDVLEAAAKAMFVLYCTGIAFTGIALFGGIAGLIADGRISALVNLFLCILAFLAVAIASAIETAIAVKAVDTINKYGNDIGISATKGTKFMAMTWVATALLFVASCLWVYECCVGRRKRRYTTANKERY